MQISYIDGMETIDIPYSDKRLISEIAKRIKNGNANNIEMWFCQNSEDYGTVFVNICNKQMENGHIKAVASSVLYLHEIHLTEENFKDNLKEYQREKRLIKKSFPNVKVSSNFR